jgi:cysteine desulfurase
MEDENARLLRLRTKLHDGIMCKITDVYVNGDMEHRLAGNLNISFAYVEGEGLMGDLADLSLSSGSACTSASLEPSYVLRALGVTEDLAHTSLRFGLGRFTTEAEIDYTIQHVVDAVNRLREMSPLYEMAKEGIDITKIKWESH